MKSKLLTAIAAGVALFVYAPNSHADNDLETEVMSATEIRPLENILGRALPDNYTEESVRYALVVVASGRGERGDSLSDPIDRNCFWLGGVRVYDSLKSMGFKPENMSFLYSTGDPDFTDTIEARAIAELKAEQFNGSYNNKATEANIASMLRIYSQKVDENDVFVLYIGTHGAQGFLEIEADGYFSSLSVQELQRMVEPINPETGVMYLDSCHSGAFISQLNLPEFALFSTTGSHTYGWGYRYFSGGTFFFQNLTDPEADTNVDGRITLREAFTRSNVEAAAHMLRIDEYLREEYNWGFGSYETEVATGQISVQQTMIVGEETSAEFYFVDTGMSPAERTEQ